MKPQTFAAICMALVLVVFAHQIALAHARPKTCTPAINGTVTTSPTEVKCTFSEAFVVNKSSLAVYDANNNQVDNKDNKLDAADKENTTLVVTLNTAKVSNGLYTVKWTSTANDGHEASGDWRFGVGFVVPAALPRTGAETLDSIWPLLAALGAALLLGGRRLVRQLR